MKYVSSFVTSLVCIISTVCGQPSGASQTLAVKVPTQFRVTRSIGAMAVNIDTGDKTLADVKIDVGSAMITGVQYEWFVYPKGSPRSKARTGSSYLGGTNFKAFTFEDVLRSNASGVPFPKPGVTYIVEMKLTVFETDVPFQKWNFTDIEKYKVLWTHTLKKTVGP
ncbi:MAG TPA: hypothetical protein VG733_12250 [Chthoniobacteraceae bacterium]|nr:hypothetical protein [Chthoniobacteraceae bacterium]